MNPSPITTPNGTPLPWQELNAPPRLLLVDDEPANLQLLKRVLEADYRLSFARNGMEALARAQSLLPDLIILDVMMPDMTGHQVITELKANPATSHIPVLFCTAMDQDDDEAHGLTLGAVDYVTKPISPAVLRARVSTHLKLVQRGEVERTRLELIRRLGRAAEFKDNETGMHVLRMSHYSRLVAQKLGAPAAFCDLILAAAPMHDVGKIGIADHVLLKPGKLTEEEWAVMRRHPEIGAEIIGDDPSPLLQMARRIALQHHEKWDGSGYPNGLHSSAICIEAQIVAVTDVFDALTSARPYKPAWTVERAVDLLREQSGSHFAPEVAQAFLQCLDEVLAIKASFLDTEHDQLTQT